LQKLIQTLAAAAAVLAAAVVPPAGAFATEGTTGWSAPLVLQDCPALEGGWVLFPSNKPEHPTGAGAIVWRASSACPGGEGPRVSRIGTGEAPGSPTVPSTTGGRPIGPRGTLEASTAPHGQILIAGTGGGAPIQGPADGPFAPLSGLSSSPAPLAITRAYLGDVALASPTPGGHLKANVERFFARTFDRSSAVSSGDGRSAQGLSLAMDFRSDALAVWAQGGSIYARDMPASGAPHSIQRLAAAAGRVRIASLLSDDNRGIVAWSEESKGETAIYVDRSAVGVRFGSPVLLERFPNPDGLPSPPGSPGLVRLSSESVMMAWGGAAAGHWVVRTAAIDLQGVGAPTTIGAPGGDALLADLATGPDGDALLLWTQPQQSPGAPPDMQSQAIFAARGFDAYPKQTIFGHPEEVTPPGPNSDATVALDPGNDHALALWRGQGGALEYAIRTPSNSP
jgi:hypothetical protein